MSKYVIGLDFGTLSGRAMLVAADTGEVVKSCVAEYPHGTLTNALPDGTPILGRDWCLQVPSDYIDVLTRTITSVVDESGVAVSDIIGMAMDCTASTIIPLGANNTPLCDTPCFQSRPHAYIKLWKHHAAQPEADEINEKLAAIPNNVRAYYGERISSEIPLPKLLQIVHDDPEVYQNASNILEVPDWLNRMLTGEVKQSISTAGYKAMYFNEQGYIDRGFLRTIHPMLENYVTDKLGGEVCPIDKPFGYLSAEWANRLHLREGIAVGCSMIDAHACMLGCGITAPGTMMLSVGTSSVQSVLSKTAFAGEGVIGTLRDCLVPGYYAWETGLAAVGDQLAWYAANCTGTESCTDPAEITSRIEKLTHQAAKLKPGESRLLALDWWNGNKTPYVNGGLAGVVLGLRLDTTPAMLFRSMMESLAYGTKCILERFERAGASVDSIIACSGIAHKNPVPMQIFADVLGREIQVTASKEAGCMGAAIIAATAAGKYAGGWESLAEAAKHMTSVLPNAYKPIPEHTAVYNELYGLYTKLSSALGRDMADVFDRLADHTSALKG